MGKLKTLVTAIFIASAILISGCASLIPFPTNQSTAESSSKNKEKRVKKSSSKNKKKRVKKSSSYTYKVRGKTYKTLASSKSYRKTGSASWYGKPFHGRKTANGETYNMHHMTAAHKSLPLGSKVKVTNLNNKRSVVVRVNDRGPFHGNRIIDVSYAAAKKLGFIHTGVSRVTVTAVQ